VASDARRAARLSADDEPELIDRLAVLPSGQTIWVAAVFCLWDLEARTGGWGINALEADPQERDRMFNGAMWPSMEALLVWEARCYEALERCGPRSHLA
jgi:hypothetical protein